MIIGNGMIGSSFSSLYKNSSGVLIFASGVSDSSCTDSLSFKREMSLLNETISIYKNVDNFIYFSTCSIYDPTLNSQPYVLHKKLMEKIVLSHSRGQVIRLPQVAGPQAPPRTLLASLKQKILVGEDITVWVNASRNIIDVEDVLAIVSFFIKKKSFPSKILNVANIRSYSIDHIIQAMSRLLNIQVSTSRIDKGGIYNIDVTNILNILELAGVEFNDNYLDKVIIKYYV
jgi:nucleoside-diphosphate-sugar epimerase